MSNNVTTQPWWLHRLRCSLYIYESVNTLLNWHLSILTQTHKNVQYCNKRNDFRIPFDIFQIVFFSIPENSSFISHELFYFLLNESQIKSSYLSQTVLAISCFSLGMEIISVGFPRFNIYVTIHIEETVLV